MPNIISVNNPCTHKTTINSPRMSCHDQILSYRNFTTNQKFRSRTTVKHQVRVAEISRCEWLCPVDDDVQWLLVFPNFKTNINIHRHIAEIKSNTIKGLVYGVLSTAYISCSDLNAIPIFEWNQKNKKYRKRSQNIQLQQCLVSKIIPLVNQRSIIRLL